MDETFASLTPMQLLRRLHAARYCDREIADRLNDPALHYWSRMKPDDRRNAMRPVALWTARRVRYWRAKLGLPARRHLRAEWESLTEAREFRRSLRLARWQHLLPGPAASAAQPGRLDLKPREADALDALYGGGSPARLTRAELVARCGWPGHAHSGGRTYLGRLVESGLVVVLGMVRRDGALVRLYALASWVRPYQGSGHQTAVDAGQRIAEFAGALSSHIDAARSQSAG